MAMAIEFSRHNSGDRKVSLHDAMLWMPKDLLISLGRHRLEVIDDDLIELLATVVSPVSETDLRSFGGHIYATPAGCMVDQRASRPG